MRPEELQNLEKIDFFKMNDEEIRIKLKELADEYFLKHQEYAFPPTAREISDFLVFRGFPTQPNIMLIPNDKEISIKGDTKSPITGKIINF